MSTTKPDSDTEWSREDPKVDGVYWWRADANDPDPDIHSVVAGRFYEVGMSQCTAVENFGGEWLGPISPSDFEQLLRLRKTASEARDWFAWWVESTEAAPPLGTKGANDILAAFRETLAHTGEQL